MNGGHHASPVRLDLDFVELVPVRVVAAAPRDGGTRVGAVDVLIQLEPEDVERVRAVVDVGDRLVPSQDVRRCVDARVDRVVSPVLPVGRTRNAGDRAGRAGRIGKHQRGEDVARIGRLGGGAERRCCADEKSDGEAAEHD